MNLAAQDWEHYGLFWWHGDCCLCVILFLQDVTRTGTYHAAIAENRADFEGKAVMDVGAGSGILSLFAAQVCAAARWHHAASYALAGSSWWAARGLRCVKQCRLLCNLKLRNATKAISMSTGRSPLYSSLDRDGGFERCGAVSHPNM
jgi:hypothetical protein